MSQRIKMKGLAILLLTISGVAHAGSPPSASEIARTLTKEIHSLNYANEDQRFTGGQKARKGVVLFETFAKLPKADKERAKLFKELMILVREAGPFDEENQLAEVLADTMKADASLKASYKEYVQSLSSSPKGIEQCKSLQFESNVGETSCLMEAGISSSQDIAASERSAAKKCQRPFSFDACLSKK